MSNGLGIFGDTVTAELTPVAGWTHAYNVNTDLVNTTTTGSGTVTSVKPFAVISTTANASSTARIETRRVLRYLPGMGGVLRVTAVFSEPQLGSYQYVGLGTSENGLYFGYNVASTEFCVIRKSDGTEATPIYQSDFTGNFDPNIDFTKGNVFQIRYQWLGFGRIEYTFETLNPAQDGFIPFHTIYYPNTQSDTSLVNPTMPVFAEAGNTTNDTNVVLKSPSAMAFREGAYIPRIDPLTVLRSFSNTATGITTEAPILSIRSKSTYQSVTNLIQPYLTALSGSVDGTKSVTIRVYRGGSLTGASFSDYDINTSSLEYDTSASALSNGIPVFEYNLAKVDSINADVSVWNLQLEVNELLTITAESTASADVQVSVLMSEPF